MLLLFIILEICEISYLLIYAIFLLSTVILFIIFFIYFVLFYFCQLLFYLFVNGLPTHLYEREGDGNRNIHGDRLIGLNTFLTMSAI